MSELLERINGLELLDIITVGYCENVDGILSYKPWLDSIYLKFKDFYLLIKTSHHDLFCTIKRVSKVKLEVEIEEEDSLCFSSIYDLVILDSVSDHIINSYDLLSPEITSHAGITCMGLYIKTDLQTLFFDPSTISGIKIRTVSVE